MQAMKAKGVSGRANSNYKTPKARMSLTVSQKEDICGWGNSWTLMERYKK